jgi:hypothetical protein
MHFGVGIGHWSAHRAARKEDKDVNQQVTENEQGNRRARQNGRSKRNGAHDASKRGLIDVVSDFKPGTG